MTTGTTGFERDGPGTADRARVALVALLGAVLTLCFGFRVGAFGLVVGGGAIACSRLRGAWQRRGGTEAGILFLIAAEIALVAWALFAGVPFAHAPPAPMFFFSPALLCLLCLLALNALEMRPLTTWWSGVSILAVWFAARLIVLADPATITKESVNDDDYPTLLSYLAAVTRPHYFNKDVWVFQIAAISGCVVILGLAAHRLRRLGRQAVEADAARAALATHFSAPVVETLLQADRSRFRGSGKLTVVDCDLVGFSSFAARQSSDETAALLKMYHSLVEESVFRFGGAVLKFTGDGVSAVFGLSGTLEPPASCALACARRLAADWEQRARSIGVAAIPAIAVGVESGDAAWEIVGAGRTMSLVVIGPAVDAAARLQAQTRVVQTALLAGPAVVEAVGRTEPPTVGDWLPAKTEASAFRLAPGAGSYP